MEMGGLEGLKNHDYKEKYIYIYILYIYIYILYIFFVDDIVHIIPHEFYEW